MNSTFAIVPTQPNPTQTTGQPNRWTIVRRLRVRWPTYLPRSKIQSFGGCAAVHQPPQNSQWPGSSGYRSGGREACNWSMGRYDVYVSGVRVIALSSNLVANDARDLQQNQSSTTATTTVPAIRQRSAPGSQGRPSDRGRAGG